MADINVSIINPTDGKRMTVDLDDTITAQEIIVELINDGFINASDEGYKLGIKGGAMIGADQSLASAQVPNGTTLRVVPSTNAGAMV
ncbi:hypothetical protein BKI52_15880 [marine bacterium AO1-C]|nr:hypothetical protein BKI52_15880 [marine bacterium AO1-C]